MDDAHLKAFLPDPAERRRFLNYLPRLSMRAVSVPKLLRRAGLEHRSREVRAALAADPRYERLARRGPERWILREEHRHAAKLRATIHTTTRETPAEAI